MVLGWFPWHFKVVSCFFMVFWLVSMIFLGSFMVSHGFWLVSMIFQGSFGSMEVGWGPVSVT